MRSIHRWTVQLRDALQAIAARVRRGVAPRAKAVGYAVLLLIAAALLLLLIRNWRNIDWRTYRLDPGCLALSIPPHAFAFSLGALGWALIVRKIDDSQTLGESFRIYFLSSIGRNIPGGFWHVAGRIHLHNRAGGSGAVTVVATAVELVLAVLAGTAIYAIGVLVSGVDSVVPRSLLIALLVRPLTWTSLLAACGAGIVWLLVWYAGTL